MNDNHNAHGDDNAASTPGSNRSDKAKDDNTKGSNADSSKASGAATDSNAPPPSANIHMRCLIVTQDASVIIGKGGAHVNEIREKSGARVMVSESIPGNPERILNVSGPLDAVSKVRISLRMICFLLNNRSRLLASLFDALTMSLSMYLQFLGAVPLQSNL